MLLCLTESGERASAQGLCRVALEAFTPYLLLSLSASPPASTLVSAEASPPCTQQTGMGEKIPPRAGEGGGETGPSPPPYTGSPWDQAPVAQNSDSPATCPCIPFACAPVPLWPAGPRLRLLSLLQELS